MFNIGPYDSQKIPQKTVLEFKKRFKVGAKIFLGGHNMYIHLHCLYPYLCSTFVGGEANDLADKVPHKLVGLGQLALVLGGAGLKGVLGGLVSLLHTNAHLIPRSHFKLL